MGYSTKNKAYTSDTKLTTNNVEVNDNIQEVTQIENINETENVEINDNDKECVKHMMSDGTVMDGPVHGEGQKCVEWVSRDVTNDEPLGNVMNNIVIENYDEDKDFSKYMNTLNMKRSKSVVSGLTTGMLDMIDNLNKRLMYLEYKSEISYEMDKNQYVDYNKILMLIRNGN